MITKNLETQEEHKTENPLRDVILGGQDGLVNSLGIILGISAAGGNQTILIATVLAACFAESISMGAVAYTSAMAQKDYYWAERKREEKEVDEVPEIERDEIRQIYTEKGFTGKILEEIVRTITSDKKIWVDSMMADELHLSPVNTRDVLKSSVIVTIATTIGHLLPLLPFFLVDHQTGLIAAILISAVSLFATGVYQALTLVGSWWKMGLKMVAIGIGAAFIGFLIAKVFNIATA